MRHPALVTARPAYGYRRITAILNCQLRPEDLAPVNHKTVCRIMRTHSLLLGCGTGVGASIAGNKVKSIRAAICHEIHSAHQCVERDDVNVICIGA